MPTPRFRKPKPFGSRSKLSESSKPKKAFISYVKVKKQRTNISKGYSIIAQH
ncbi:hypothetical protein [Fusibacter sp. 3D3]|uniref:hypothetical protein n=1 Tax=Fusibacter sp. 3D3 TaxID=1048380 RepID=UPI00085518DF|nr:hypothetical protein [Fusibacter sp. 3D3]GAU78645.1 hypothetical protein F3D3_3280 [Fusibacter sp. 3D3]